MTALRLYSSSLPQSLGNLFQLDIHRRPGLQTKVSLMNKYLPLCKEYLHFCLLRILFRCHLIISGDPYVYVTPYLPNIPHFNI